MSRGEENAIRSRDKPCLSDTPRKKFVSEDTRGDHLANQQNVLIDSNSRGYPKFLIFFGDKIIRKNFNDSVDEDVRWAYVIIYLKINEFVSRDWYCFLLRVDLVLTLMDSAFHPVYSCHCLNNCYQDQL